MGLIYLATSKTSGKSYVGQTIRTLSVRMAEHKYQSCKLGRTVALCSAIRKYGFDDFTWSILEHIEGIDLLNEREMFWIAKLDTYNTGYNSDKGGTNHMNREISDHTRRLRSINSKGVNNAMYGKKHTDETRAKIRQWHVSLSPERRLDINRSISEGKRRRNSEF